jgi:hypothetical protein
MATIATLITELRTDLSDDNSTRFTDTQLLNLFKKAIRRANRIVQRNSIQFGKKKKTINTISAQTYIDISVTGPVDVSDFDVWIGLFRDSDHFEIIKRTEREWETDASQTASTYCLLDQVNSKIYFNGTPDAIQALTLWYFPTVDPSAYTVSSSTPWGGRIDDIIMEYVGLRARNIDEMDVSFDKQLLEDMENNIIQAYTPNAVTITDGNGWL